ncbi:MAG TPA: hypothetical protein VJ804_11040, partial [Acidimicrobiales bacterium]|nr:hypothetical protein [Acidimicrobiales bacterium]
MLRRRRIRLLTAVVLLTAAVLLHPTTASAGAAHGTGLTAPPRVSVGTVIDATILITNTSTPPESAATHAVTDISLTPSCGSATPDVNGNCPEPDVGVITPSITGMGAAGTACAGVTFSIAPASSPGEFALGPSVPLVLGPPGEATDSCEINLTLTVQRMPAADALPDAGNQTVAIVSSIGTSTTGTTSFASGARPITVEKAAPQVTTQVVDA